MAQIIDINKDLIPYDFDIVLSEKTYNMAFSYNETENSFYVDLSRNGTILVTGERLTYGTPLFDQVSRDINGIQDPEYPIETIAPYDLSKGETRITFNNFQETVFLYIFN